MRMLTSLMTAALLVSAGPALAAGKTAPPKPAAPAKTVAAAASASPDVKYCVEGDVTGTRIRSQECKTKEQWAKEGVDIDQALKD